MPRIIVCPAHGSHASVTRSTAQASNALPPAAHVRASSPAVPSRAIFADDTNSVPVEETRCKKRFEEVKIVKKNAHDETARPSYPSSARSPARRSADVVWRRRIFSSAAPAAALPFCRPFAALPPMYFSCRCRPPRHFVARRARNIADIASSKRAMPSRRFATRPVIRHAPRIERGETPGWQAVAVC